MPAGVSLLDTDVMPICIIIALDIVITLRFSINCSTVISSPTVLFAILEKTLVKPMVPGSIFHNITFRSTILQSFIFRYINQKTQKYFIFCLVYSISIRSHLLQLTVKGLTTPLSRWLRGSYLVV